MKSKKINKKLSFNKSTIADLNFKELNDARGGLGTSAYNCDTCTTCAFTCHYTCGGTCPATCDDLTCFHAGTACLD